MKKLLTLMICLLVFSTFTFASGQGGDGSGKKIEIRDMTAHLPRTGMTPPILIRKGSMRIFCRTLIRMIWE